jgi:CBS domain-containing protein
VEIGIGPIRSHGRPVKTHPAAENQQTAEMSLQWTGLETDGLLHPHKDVQMLMDSPLQSIDTPIRTLLEKKGREVFTVQADQTVYAAIAEMEVRNVGSLIVKDGDKVVGIITERDYLRKVILKGRASKETAVSTIMSTGLHTVSPEDTVSTALSLMTEKRCRHLPVFDGDQLVGLVSTGDLVKEIMSRQKFMIQLLKDYMSSR